MSSRGFPITRALRKVRRDLANERQAAYDELTIQQKLDRLPFPPAAKKQREKLLAQLEGKTKSVTIVDEKLEEAQEEDEVNLKAKDRRSKERRD